MSRLLKLWSPSPFQHPSNSKFLDEMACREDSTPIGPILDHPTNTPSLISSSSLVASSLIISTKEKENYKIDAPEPSTSMDDLWLSEKLVAKQADYRAARCDMISDISETKTVRPETPSTISSQKVAFNLSGISLSSNTPQRSVSSSSTSTNTVRFNSVSRNSFSSTRSLSTGSIYHRQIYSPDFRSRTPHLSDPRFLPVKRSRHGYLGHHPSVKRSLRYSPLQQRSVSLPPLLEGDLNNFVGILGEGDTSSVRSGLSTMSRIGRVSSLNLHMDGPDHKGWIKAPVDYQIKMIIPSPSLSGSRIPSLSSDLGDWQLDGTYDRSAKDSTLLIDKTERKFRSSDSDRGTRGSSEVVLHDSASGYDITREDEERGKEAEWERREEEEREPQSKDERPWKQRLKQTWERARCWFGFRFLTW